MLGSDKLEFVGNFWILNFKLYKVWDELFNIFFIEDISVVLILYWVK